MATEKAETPERGSVIIGLATRVGPLFGCIMGLCYAAAYAIYFLRDSDLGSLAQVFFGLGFAAMSLGLGRAIRGLSSLFVASEAEKRIDSDALTSSSNIPVIQREIDLQRAGTSPVANRESREAVPISKE